MIRILFIFVSFFSLQNILSQCNSTIVFNNDSTQAICTDSSATVVNIYTNNFPDHAWGSWPSNSPVNAFDLEYHYCRYPEKADQFVSLYNATGVDNCSQYVKFGIGLNGVFYSGWGARWFVNPNTMQENTDWNVEANAAFNMGFNNAHSNNAGEYHYHGVPIVYYEDSLNIDGSTHSPIVAYAADGFPVYYKYAYSDANDATSGISTFISGHTLIPGNRPGDGITAPDGPYDGYYAEDYEYIVSNWDLDECNGRYGVTPDYPNGTYYYLITDNWPYIPRCFYGTIIDNSFRIGPNCPSSTSEEDCNEKPAEPIDSIQSIQFTEQISYQVYPNPSNSSINIDLNYKLSALLIDQITLYDMKGNIWFSSNKFVENIDISELSSSHYFIQINAGKSQVTNKIIIK